MTSPDGGVMATSAPPLRDGFSMASTAIFLPSGDHFGCESAAFIIVSCASAWVRGAYANSAGLPRASETKAIWLESGDQAGSDSSAFSAISALGFFVRDRQGGSAIAVM